MGHCNYRFEAGTNGETLCIALHTEHDMHGEDPILIVDVCSQTFDGDP